MVGGICGYKLRTNLQNCTQKDSTEIKIFQKVLGATFFLKHPVLPLNVFDVIVSP